MNNAYEINNGIELIDLTDFFNIFRYTPFMVPWSLGFLKCI